MTDEIDTATQEIIDQFLSAAGALDRAVEVFQDHVNDLNAALAKIGPMKIGDDVVCNGYSYRGKLFRVEAVFFRRGWDYGSGRGLDIIAEGSVLKADGAPGKVQGFRSIKIDL